MLILPQTKPFVKGLADGRNLLPAFRLDRTFLPISHAFYSHEIRLSHRLSAFSRLVVHGAQRFRLLPPCWRFSVQVNTERI